MRALGRKKHMIAGETGSGRIPGLNPDSGLIITGRTLDEIIFNRNSVPNIIYGEAVYLFNIHNIVGMLIALSCN